MSGGLFIVRVRFLVELLQAGAPVKRTGQRGRRAEHEATIVLGQRKLLQRLGPGLIHAFIFWGFLVLGPTIVIAMIGVVSKHATFPWLGHQGWYAFLVDVFAVLVLIGVVCALWIRKVQRPPRFEGSHLGEADLILALIATIATTLLLWHATRIALGLNEWPASAAPVSHLLSHLFGRDGATRVLERVFVWAHVLTILGFLAYLPRSKHLHIASAAFNVWYGRTGPAGRLEPLTLRRPGHPRGGHPLRRGHGRRPHLEADARHVLLHGVRALPGRLPGLCHRQGAQSQAAHHGAARPGVRRRGSARPGACGKRWRCRWRRWADRSHLSRSQRCA